MADDLPINFEEKAKTAGSSNGKGYPYQLSAKDLMKDFVFSSPVIDKETPNGNKNGITVTETTGQSGYKARKLSCTHVEEAKTNGALLVWKNDKYTPIKPPQKIGTIIYWDGENWHNLDPPPTGTSTGGTVTYYTFLGHTGTRPIWRSGGTLPVAT